MVAAAVEVRALGRDSGRVPAHSGRTSSSASPVARSTRTCRIGVREAGEGDVGGAVVVPGEVGVDAVDGRDRRAVAPRAGRVGRGEDDAAAAAQHHRDDDVEDAVPVPDGRRPDAARRRHLLQLDLLRPGRDVADLLPVDQVGAAVDRQARQVLERRGDQVVDAVDADDARVGVEPGQQRVHAASRRDRRPRRPRPSGRAPGRPARGPRRAG